MKSPPILNLEKQDPRAQVAEARAAGETILNRENQDPEVQEVSEARAAGETIIRRHLDNHLAHNGGGSSDYISWIATLHPENAQVEIDERFFIPGNPWWSIYEETVDIPYATAVAVPAADAGDERTQHQQSNVAQNAEHEEDVQCISSNTSHVTDDAFAGQEVESHVRRQEELPHFCLRCNPVDMGLGILSTCLAIVITFITELTALIFYFVAAFFFHAAKAIGPPRAFTACLRNFYMIMYFVFAMVDSALLLSSVIAAESCGMVGWIVGCLVGGIWIANKRHQFVRRICHRIRWAFRHSHLEPPRTFCKQRRAGTEMADTRHNDFASIDFKAHTRDFEESANHFDTPLSSTSTSTRTTK